MGTWIFLGIFFGIIIVLIVVAIFGARKDKNEKLIKNDEVRKLRTKAEEGRILIFASLNNNLNKLNKELKDFKPSIGLKSLGDINKEFSDLVKDIKKSDELKNVYLSEDYQTELKPVIESLSASKPSNWISDAQFAINIVNAKYNQIITNSDNAELVNEGKDKKWS